MAQVVVDEVQQHLRVGQNRSAGDRMHVLEHDGHGGFRPLHQFEVAAAPVIQVGQDHVITGGRQAARHVVQLFAFAGRVHVEDDGRVRAALFGVGHKGVHGAVWRGDVYVAVDHGVLGVGWSRHLTAALNGH